MFALICRTAASSNNSPNFGTNTCDLVSREPGSFQLSNGFQLGFLNLAATEIRALNSTLEYSLELSRLFGSQRSLGNLEFDLSYYHLFAFRESATGRFDDTQESQGSVARPRNKSRLTTRYANGPWTAQLTWQYNDHTKVFNAGAPATPDAFQVIELPSFSIYDFSLGFRFNTKYRANLAVANILDKNLLGQNGANLSFVDSIGRRLSLSVTADFE